MSEVREKIRRDMQPLLKEARETGSFLVCPSQGVRFTADELEEMWAAGSFWWGASNWKLVPAIEIFETLHRDAGDAIKRFQDFRDKYADLIAKSRGAVK